MRTATGVDVDEELDEEEQEGEGGQPKKSVKKFANETDDDECQDYLLSMPIKSFTIKKIKELSDAAKKLKGEIKELESKSLSDLWEADLVEFEKELTKQDNRDRDFINNAIKKKMKQKGHKKAKKPIVAWVKKDDNNPDKKKVDKDGKKIQGPKPLPGQEKKKKKDAEEDSTQDPNEKKVKKPRKKKEENKGDSDTDMSSQDAKKKPKIIKEKATKEKETKKPKAEESSSLFDKQKVQREKSDVESSADKVNATLKRKQNGSHKANVKKRNFGSESDSDAEEQDDTHS